MALWPWRKRSKTNSGGKRPANPLSDDSKTDFDPSARPHTPVSIRSVSNHKTKRRNGTIKSIRKATSRKNTYSARMVASSEEKQTTSGSRDVQMSSPSPTRPSVAQLQTPIQTPPPSQPISSQTPEMRRSASSSSSHRPHKRNILKKIHHSEDLGRNYPSPPPDQNNPHLFRTFSTQSKSLKRSNSRFLPFTRRSTTQFERPLSELSMRTHESLQSQDSIASHSSMRAFKVRSLDVLSPRPTLRLSSNPYTPTLAQQKMVDYPSSHERKTSKSGWKQGLRSPIAEEPPSLKRNRVYGLADDLDSKGLREALERDARRRERKQKEDEAKAQVKLEKRAAKQQAEEDKIAMQAYSQSQKRARENNENHTPEIPGAEGAIIPTVINKNERPSSKASAKSPATGTQTPMSWLQGPSQENLHKQNDQLAIPEVAEPRKSLDSASFRSDNTHDEEAIVVETATAVRLSGISAVSPPPSPTMTRTPKIVDHSPTHSRKMSRDLRFPEDQEEESEENQALANAWTAFFKKATAARVQKEHEAQEEALRQQTQDTDDNEARDTETKLPDNLMIPGTFLASPTPRSERSRVNSEQLLPDNLPTPKQSQLWLNEQGSSENISSTQLSRKVSAPVSSNRITPVSPLSRNFSEARRSGTKNQLKSISPRQTQTELEKYMHGGGHISDISFYVGASGRNSMTKEREPDRIKSMASIDSEGSWLSGRLNSRQSLHQIPSIRDSAASLKHQYHDIKAHEDRRASVADDQYFSGVQDVESSDEDEREILNSYLDDDNSVHRSSLNSPQSPPQNAYRSPPRSPISEDTHKADDSDTDPDGDKYMWREGLGRRPTITRVDSNFIRKREEIGSVYDASSMDTSDYSHVAMSGELVMEDPEGNMVVPDRGRDSPSPTLGKGSPRFVTPKEFPTSNPFPGTAISSNRSSQ